MYMFNTHDPFTGRKTNTISKFTCTYFPRQILYVLRFVQHLSMQANSTSPVIFSSHSIQNTTTSATDFIVHLVLPLLK